MLPFTLVLTNLLDGKQQFLIYRKRTIKPPQDKMTASMYTNESLIPLLIAIIICSIVFIACCIGGIICIICIIIECVQDTKSNDDDQGDNLRLGPVTASRQ